MKAIGLAAGKLGFIDHSPADLRVGDHTLLDIQVSILRNSGIEDVHYVLGYRANPERLRAAARATVNEKWSSTTAVHSLSRALEADRRDDADLLVFYGDTIFEAGLVRDLLKSKQDFTACVSLANPTDAYREWSTLANGQVASVHSTSASPDGDAFSVFTGMLLVKARKLAYFREKAARAKDLPDLLNSIAADGEGVHAHVVKNGWMELRGSESIHRLHKDRAWLGSLIQIHVDWSSRSVKYDKLDWVNRDILLNAIGDVCAEKSPRRHLDLGTGTGKVLNYIRQRFPECEGWGVDYSESMIAKVQNKDKFKLLVANAEDLAAVPSGHFDVVTARMLFHHVHDVDRAMSEAARVLKPGGVLIVCEGNPPSLRSVDWYTKMFALKEDRHTITEVDLINYFVRAKGLSDIRTRTIVMPDCSLNNWLDNSGIPEMNIREIKRLHHEAPDHVRQDYRMKFEGGDCLMDWKFSVTSATKA